MERCVLISTASPATHNDGSLCSGLAIVETGGVRPPSRGVRNPSPRETDHELRLTHTYTRLGRRPLRSGSRRGELARATAPRRGVPPRWLHTRVLADCRRD